MYKLFFVQSSKFGQYFKRGRLKLKNIAWLKKVLLTYLVNNNYSLREFYELIESENFKFDGVDGNFYFKNNLIERELKILQIKSGKALRIN